MLEVRQVSKRFGGLRAVSEVGFAVGAGELVAVFGPNGSGKTTLLNLVAGTLAPTSGSVALRGIQLTGLRPADVAAHGVIKTFQNPKLFPELTVRDHLRIAGHLQLKRRLGSKRFVPGVRSAPALEAAVAHCIERCSLSAAAGRVARDLSYGEEKMLGVAMALMCQPAVLLLDEPASGLGKAEIEKLSQLLHGLRTGGMAICVIDHRIRFLAEIADKAIALQQGAVIARGTPREVLDSDAVRQAYLGGADAAA